MKRFPNRPFRYLLLLTLVIITSPLWALEITATTQWYQRVDITPLRSGTIENIPVMVGEPVKQGALLLHINSDLEESQLLLAQKRLEQQKLLHAEAQREYERVQDLYDRTLISDHDRAVGEAAWVGASTTMQSAIADLAKAERAMGYSQVKAPFDAVVVAVNATVGTPVNSSIAQSPLLTIASSRSMVVDGYLSVKQFGKVAKGKSVKIKLAGKTIKGKVESIAMEPETDSSEQYRLRLLIPYSEGLRAGTKATILLD